MTKVFLPDERLTNAICGFAKHIVPLKIIVKARDELELTRSWIEHHAAIVGLENLLIADNASSLPEVFDIYRSFGPSLNWFSFSGHHNSINIASCFPQLYGALAAASRYAAFVDMDERLLGFTENTWVADESICHRLATTSASLISAPWLQNVSGKDNQFELYREQLEWGVLFGKPLISTSNPALGAGRIHTLQYPVDDAAYLGLGVLHLSHLSITQRLRTNKNKLMQRGVVSSDSSYSEIAAMSIGDGPPDPLVTLRCIEEIRQLLALHNEGADSRPTDVPAERIVTLSPDHQLVFGSKQVQTLFMDFARHESEQSMGMLPATPQFTL